MIIARHPNRDGITLLFPPIGADSAGLITKAMSDPRTPAGTLELARLGPDDRQLISRLRQIGASAPHKERVLDWTFPVRIISPAKVVAHTGGEFLSLRGHLSRATRAELTAEPVDVRRHRDDLVKAVNQWADQRQHSGFTHDDMTSPTLAVLDLMEAGELVIKGSLTRDQAGNCIGFWLWEENGAEAYSLARVALRYPGNAELAILHTCEQLAPRGINRIPEMCLGGSETEELDRFKQEKMRPVDWVDLQTMTLPRRPGRHLRPSRTGMVAQV